MWELGTSIYLAVASGYPSKMIAVFRLDVETSAEGETTYNWVREDDLAEGQDLSNLKVFIVSNEKLVHLYAVRYVMMCLIFSYPSSYLCSVAQRFGGQ